MEERDTEREQECAELRAEVSSPHHRHHGGGVLTLARWTRLTPRCGEVSRLEEAAKQNKYRRASHYGNIMDKADGAAVMSGYAGNTLSMTSDPTGLPAAMKAEKRRTMAYVKT